MPDADEDLMGDQSVVRRIMWTGTWWFAAAVVALAVLFGLLLATGWRPSVLPIGDEIFWWVGAAVTGLSLGLLGWSGCPIIEVDVKTGARNKTRTMQLGTLFFILGFAACLTAVMLGP